MIGRRDASGAAAAGTAGSRPVAAKTGPVLTVTVADCRRQLGRPSKCKRGVDPARARASATSERVATLASKGMALPSDRSGLADCDGSGLWLSRRHPLTGAAPYRNAGEESGARAASAGRGPAQGQDGQALRRPQGRTPQGKEKVERMAGTGAWHRVPVPRGFGQRRAAGAPGDRRRQALDINSANCFLRAAGSGTGGTPGSRTGASTALRALPSPSGAKGVCLGEG